MGPLEIHVSADVGIAAWDYYRVTRDRSWLERRGFPLIAETARFWASRVERMAGDSFNINHVVGADEYAVDVDDDAFTNAAARTNLEGAVAAARVLGLDPDPAGGVTPACISVPALERGVTREFTQHDGGTIRQADVSLLAYPLNVITDPAQVRRDFQYYAPRSDDVHGPAMNNSILASRRWPRAPCLCGALMRKYIRLAPQLPSFGSAIRALVLCNETAAVHSSSIRGLLVIVTQPLILMVCTSVGSHTCIS
jgi:trehalose/maltose hydrolase-like predicted phosphorylase